jgi:hypothetical protein
VRSVFVLVGVDYFGKGEGRRKEGRKGGLMDVSEMDAEITALLLSVLTLMGKGRREFGC